MGNSIMTELVDTKSSHALHVMGIRGSEIGSSCPRFEFESLFHGAETWHPVVRKNQCLVNRMQANHNNAARALPVYETTQRQSSCARPVSPLRWFS